MSDFKKDVDERLSSLTLSPALRQKILDAAETNETTPAPKPRHRVRRAALGIAAALVIMVGGVGAAAAAFPSFESFLSRMGQDMRDTLMPMDQSVVSNGIRMEVVAAASDGQSAALYLTMQDTEGSRIDAGTQLLAAEVSGEEMHLLSMDRPVDYDEATGTATYRFDGEAMSSLLDKTLTLQVQGLLTGEIFHDSEATGYTVADVMAMNAQPATTALTEEVTSYGIQQDYEDDGRVAAELEAAIEGGSVPVLTQDNPVLQLPEGWLDKTTAGVVDGQLHLNRQPQGETGKYAWVDFGIVYGLPASGSTEDTTAADEQEEAMADSAPDDAMAAGPAQAAEQEAAAPATAPEASLAQAAQLQRPLASASLSLGTPEQVGRQQYYPATEYVLSLPEDTDPADMHIVATGNSYESYIDGEWTVEFQLNEVTEKLGFDCDIELGGWRIYRVEVSPIGITAFADGEMQEDSESLMMELRLKDGTLAGTSSGSGAANSDGDIIMRSTFTRPISLDDVQAVELNGTAYTPLPLEK